MKRLLSNKGFGVLKNGILPYASFASMFGVFGILPAGAGAVLFSLLLVELSLPRLISD